MQHVRLVLQRLTGALRAARTVADARWTVRSRRFVTTVAIVAIVIGAAVLLPFADEALIDAADSLSVFSNAGQDDGAGDAPATGSADAGRYFSVPAPFEDERVLAALGPIANLSCRKDDYAAQARPTIESPPSDLGPPIEDKSATAWLDRSATTAGLSPITRFSDADDAAGDTGEASAASKAPGRVDPLSTPLSSPQFDVDDLLTRNLLAAGLSPIAALALPESADCPALLRHTFNKLQTGQPQSLCQFQGKVLLIVNTASYCEYTKQYEGLEAMYRKYRDRGLVVVGFPSNDFGKQEPGSNQQIAEFCRTTYGVQFPMFEKSSVAKLSANPLYTELAAKTGAAPEWNFHKYVVDRNGTPIASFASDLPPDSPKLVELIERLLAEKYAKG